MGSVLQGTPEFDTLLIVYWLNATPIVATLE